MQSNLKTLLCNLNFETPVFKHQKIYETTKKNFKMFLLSEFRKYHAIPYDNTFRIPLFSTHPNLIKKIIKYNMQLKAK